MNPAQLTAWATALAIRSPLGTGAPEEIRGCHARVPI